jgi:MFS family permease
VEALFDLFLWSMAMALVAAPQGAAFGALARVVALWGSGTHEEARRKLIWQDAMSGAMFLGAMGFLAGIFLIRHGEPFGRKVAQMIMLGTGGFVLMLMAICLALMGLFFIWLGVRGTGFLIGMGIGLGFAVIAAHKFGFDAGLAALIATGIGLAGLMALIVFRLRSPHGSDAFNLWADETDGIEKSSNDFRESNS